MKISLTQAYETLQVEEGSSIDVVKAAYRKLALAHHPDKNNNNPESKEKFQEVGGAYERIVKHLEKPEREPRMGSGMPFPFSFRTAGGFGGGGFAEDYDSEENEDWSDDGWDSDNEAHAAHEDYFFWLFEEIFAGGYGSHASYKHKKEHPNEQETPEQHSQRVRAEAERLKKAQEQRDAEEKQAKEKAQKAKQREIEEAAARRQEKKKAAIASKSAAQVQAAELAQKRLAVSQQKRSTVFDAARKCDVKTVKHGIYELNVDPNGGEFLPGGKEAIEDLKSAGLDLDDVAAELSGKKGKKKKGKSSTAGSPQTSLSSQNLPGSFPPTPSPSNASPAMAQTDGLFEPSPSAPSKGKKKKNKKNKQKSTVIDVQAPLPPGFTPSTPPSEPIWKPATQPNKATTTPISTPDASFDPKETLLHLAAGHGQMELYSWLLDHGAVPEERNSAGFTAFHLALTYNHVELVEHSLSDLKPTFPKPVGSDMPDPYYPLPKNHTFLSLALIGGGKNPAKVLDLVRIVLPFVGGRDVSKAWKKAEFEQGRKFLKDWKWESWEEIKWIMAERMQKLDFDGFLPPEEYQGRRPRIF